jgi:predicted homoserine dehydrogenase-like protein
MSVLQSRHPRLRTIAMNLSHMLKARAAAGKPIRIGQVGAGKFGTMFLSQLRWTRGMHLAVIADLMPRARKSV